MRWCWILLLLARPARADCALIAYEGPVEVNGGKPRLMKVLKAGDELKLGPGGSAVLAWLHDRSRVRVAGPGKLVLAQRTASGTAHQEVVKGGTPAPPVLDRTAFEHRPLASRYPSFFVEPLPGQPETFALEEGLVSPQPSFRWTPDPRADAYSLEVGSFPQNAALWKWQGKGLSTTWQGKPLAPGQMLTLTLESRQGGQPIGRVAGCVQVGPDDLVKAERAWSKSAKSREDTLLMLYWYVQKGFRGQPALRLLETLEFHYPDDPALAELRRQLNKEP